MTYIFISYKREDRNHAEALARDLERAGYSVWWDARLTAGENFDDAIRDALISSAAAIVIWSKSSARSAYVKDEARFALSFGKLLSTKLRATGIREIPFGFGDLHTIDVEDRQGVFRSLGKLGVLPLDRHRGSSGFVRPAEHDGRESRPRANRSIKQMFSANPLSSFLAGLTLRFPRFQPISQTKWHALGVSALQATVAAVVLPNLPLLHTFFRSIFEYGTFVVLAALGAFAVLSWYLFFRVSETRAIFASIITGLTSAAITFVFIAVTLGGLLSQLSSSGAVSAAALETLGSVLLVGVLVASLLAIAVRIVRLR